MPLADRTPDSESTRSLAPDDPPQVSETGVAEPRKFTLSPGDQKFLLVAGGAIFLLLSIHLLRSGLRDREALFAVQRPRSRRLEFQLDVNSATWVEWMQLPEIGEALARRIVSDREARGPFSSIDDVDRVRGIGPATMKKIRPHLQMNRDVKDNRPLSEPNIKQQDSAP